MTNVCYVKYLFEKDIWWKEKKYKQINALTNQPTNRTTNKQTNDTFAVLAVVKGISNTTSSVVFLLHIYSLRIGSKLLLIWRFIWSVGNWCNFGITLSIQMWPTKWSTRFFIVEQSNFNIKYAQTTKYSLNFRHEISKNWHEMHFHQNPNSWIHLLGKRYLKMISQEMCPYRKIYCVDIFQIEVSKAQTQE